ncbi:hypothetical protein [Cupriavidus sp. BIS7]|uniref:hypothetical protein n=1 Tax=Cupriavidus sp. BIS7 TaxID=1217718 RepID=UPI0012F62AF6|nr:hypothetical protein [Cupriavidus sp. BIS7]
MSSKHLIVITDGSGSIVAAAIENSENSGIRVGIYPHNPEDKMYKMLDVPEEIFKQKDGEDFQRVINAYFNSAHARVRLINHNALTLNQRVALFAKEIPAQ